MDIYAEVTNRIISQMEQGIIPWQKPWIACGNAVSHTTGKPYSLLNQIPAIFHKHYAAFRDGKMNVSELARVCGISRPTAYKYLKLIA